MKKIIIALFILSIASCRAMREHKEQRKDNAAVERVTAKRSLLETVGPEWEKFHPCIPAEPIIKKGETITKIDSSFGKQEINLLSHKIDSLLNVHCQTNPDDIDSLKAAIADEVQKGCKPRLIIQTRVDTFSKPDLRAINIEKEKGQKLQDQLNQANEKINTLQGKLNRANRNFWFAIIGIAVLIALKLFIPKL